MTLRSKVPQGHEETFNKIKSYLEYIYEKNDY